MPYICELPDLDTSITFRRPDGSDIKTVDIAELEAVLIQARVDDPKFDHTNPLSLNAWMGRCRHGFSRLVGVEMSLAQTTLIVRHVQTQMAELKKTLKFEKLSTSPDSTDSTPSSDSEDLPVLLEPNSTTPTSPDNPPFVSFENVMPDPDYQRTGSAN
jgi:hypothetical protein